MVQYLVTRLALSLFALFGATLITFVAVFMSGDPVVMMLPADAGLQQIEEFRRVTGMDQPLYVQYFHFLAQAVQGNFGRSLRYDVPALGLVLERLPATIELALGAAFLATLVGIPLGVIAATRQGSLLDDLIVAITTLGLAAPTFWIGMMLIIVFAVQIHLFPPSGGGSFDKFVLPVVTLALGFIATLARFSRSEMIEVLSKQYITAARGKGLRSSTLLIRHALRNTLIPIVTLIGLQVAALLGGAVVVENVFAWPGIGSLVVTAVNNRDFPLVTAAVLVTAIIIAILNLIIDFLYAYINPTVHFQ